MYKILHIPTAYIVGDFPWSNSIDDDMTICNIGCSGSGQVIFKTIESAVRYLNSMDSYDPIDCSGYVHLFEYSVGDLDIKSHEFEIVEVDGV